MQEFYGSITRFIKKIIFCPQKIFYVGGEFFYSGKPSPTKNCMVAFNKEHVLKIENFKHRKKRNDLTTEIEILNYLKNKNGIFQPNIIKDSKHWTRRQYYIMERIYGREIKDEYPDVVLGIIEQLKLGIYHNDVKFDNVFFDGLIVRIIDYDQAYYDDKCQNLSPKETIEYLFSTIRPVWIADSDFKTLGKNNDEAKEKILSYFNGENFDFEKTSLYKSFSNKPYYSINLKGMKASGRVDFDQIRNVLDKIDFQKDEKVLDCGCDTGALTFYLNKRGCRVSSCDFERNSTLTTRILANIYNVECDVFKFNQIKNEYNTLFLINKDFTDKLSEEEKNNLTKCAKRAYIRVSNEESKNYQNFEIISELNDGDKIIKIIN